MKMFHHYFVSRHLFVIFLAIVITPAFLVAGSGSDDSLSQSQKDCLPGDGPCFVSSDESGSQLYIADWQKTDNPLADGWDTEVFNNVASKQLKALGKLIVQPKDIDQNHVKDLVVEQYSSADISGTNKKKIYKDGDLQVVRQETTEKTSDSTSTEYLGREGFARALKKIAQPFYGATGLRFKFKLFRVQKLKDSVVTRQYFSLSGITENGVLEQNATWDIRWIHNETEAPQILSIEVKEFEEVTRTQGQEKLYQDVTESILHKNTSYQDQLLHGYPEFLSSIENTLEFNIFGTPGLAVGDVNGDGLDDLYLCQEQGLPNLLFVQNSDGSATDISKKAGVNWLESSRSALLLDLDNDGDQDLAVAMPGAVIIATNDGLGKYQIVKSLPIADDPMAMAAADYDLDGDIDIYVTLYNPNRQIEKSNSAVSNSAESTFVYHDANNGPANVLFRNDLLDGKLTFTDVTQNSGVGANGNRFSLSAAWEDYDNDGDQDLYVANDYGRDNLYRNELIPEGKARFVDVATQAKIEDSAGSMGIAWGDYNRDGFMDGFVSAMWSSAGNRVTYQQSFKPESPEVKERLQRFAHGNTMLKNNGDTTFSDVSESAGIEMGRWAWSSNFVDMNNDGWEDLVVTNGFLTGDAKGGDL